MIKSAASLFFGALVLWPIDALFAASAGPGDGQDLARLASDIEWQRFLHYEPTLFGGRESRARTRDFFVSDRGFDHPLLELEAFVTRLKEGYELLAESQRDEHVRCRFPARTEWVAAKLRLSIPNETWCPKLSLWKTRIHAKSLTYVFSSYYVNNPSSTFGHTLLRLNRKDLSDLGRDSEGRQLLDFGANYGVTPTTNNPILYAAFALAGLFPGNFMVLPYFYKVREYNDYESRDLWEYDLRLSAEEVNRLTNHLWELVFTRYAYHYLTDNCGYQVLSLIETAAPRLNLTEKLRTWVIPSDTVRILQEANLIEQIHFRPSIRTQFNARRKRLRTTEEREALAKLSQSPRDESAVMGLTPGAQARVWDAAIDYVDLSNAHDILLEDSPIKKEKDAMLLRRSRLPQAEELVFQPPPQNSPLEGHPSGRLKVAQIFDRDRHETELNYRGALHDLLDPENGYPAHTRIEMGTFRLRFDNDRSRLRFDEFQLFAIESLNPWAEYYHKPAWRGELNVTRGRDLLCDNCLRGRFSSAIGLSKEWGEHFLTYALINAEFQTSSGFLGDKAAMAVGPLAGFLIRPNDRMAILTEAKELYYWHNSKIELWPDWQSRLRFFWHRQWAFEAAARMNKSESAWEVGVDAYF